MIPSQIVGIGSFSSLSFRFFSEVCLPFCKFVFQIHYDNKHLKEYRKDECSRLSYFSESMGLSFLCIFLLLPTMTERVNLFPRMLVGYQSEFSVGIFSLV